MQPILHLSIPVRDVAEAREFYVEALGCEAARTRSDFVDVWFFGLQLTLQDRPDEAGGLSEGSVRHFGVTLARPEFEEAIERLRAGGVRWISEVSTDDPGKPTEQTKAKVSDPSGNVIELKTYVDVAAALEFSPFSYPEAGAHGN